MTRGALSRSECAAWSSSPVKPGCFFCDYFAADYPKKRRRISRSRVKPEALDVAALLNLKSRLPPPRVGKLLLSTELHVTHGVARKNCACSKPITPMAFRDECDPAYFIVSALRLTALTMLM